MQDGFAAAALSLLQHIGATSAVQHSTPAVATAATSAGAAAAGALRAFTTADDARPPASKAFSHARQLAGKPHNALAVLLPVLQQLQDVKGGGLPVGPLMAVMSAVRQVRSGWYVVCVRVCVARGARVCLHAAVSNRQRGQGPGSCCVVDPDFA